MIYLLGWEEKRINSLNNSIDRKQQCIQSISTELMIKIVDADLFFWES